MAIAITEPRGGSDSANIQMKARHVNGGYVIDGEKTSITYSDTADAFVLFARTGKPDDGAKGVTAFLVPADTPGIQTTRFRDVGSHMPGRGSLFFDQVHVQTTIVLGKRGRDFPKS